MIIYLNTFTIIGLQRIKIIDNYRKYIYEKENFVAI